MNETKIMAGWWNDFVHYRSGTVSDDGVTISNRRDAPCWFIGLEDNATCAAGFEHVNGKFQARGK